MKKFGLIGYPLTHSFSKKYFSDKFSREHQADCQYDLFEIPSIRELPALLAREPDLLGLNVTIPYKEQVIPFLDRLDPACKEIGAVNCIKIAGKELVGYNTDYFGFRESLIKWLGKERPKALILGTGGASRAVAQALKSLNMDYLKITRKNSLSIGGMITYADLKNQIHLIWDYPLIINTTPLGTYPEVDIAPEIPFEQIGPQNWVYDLVYNPKETLLMKLAGQRGCPAKNGMEMLHLQAEASWEIWQ
ncbi:MAG: shikimate dehydrogenase [Cyclobacteriaceae bacterium]